MIKKAYTIYDTATNVYSDPFMMHSDEEAKRAFIDTASDPNNQISRHPSDFMLMSCGEYENSSGLFNSWEPFKVLGAWEIQDDEASPTTQ